MSVVLFLSVLLIAACGLIYELIVRTDGLVDAGCRLVDIAPTVLQLMEAWHNRKAKAGESGPAAKSAP